MRPLVSILIPAYDAEHFLAQTLRSALAQTWPNTEIFVVDDGSRDGTLAVAQSFASSRVKVIAQENCGAAGARNRAFAECQGDFIQFLDADDLLSPDKIAIQTGRLSEEIYGCVAACSWGRFIDDPVTSRFVPEPFWTDLAPVAWLVSCWERLSMMHPASWLMPRVVALRAGPWDESLPLNPYDDGEYFSRVVLASSKVCFCEGARTYYRSGLPMSLSGSCSPVARESAYRSLCLGSARLLAADDSQRTRRACARQFQAFVYAAYPDVPELITQAEDQVRKLGGADLPCPCGPKFRFVSHIIGWRLAKRLQRLQQRWFRCEPRNAP